VKSTEMNYTNCQFVRLIPGMGSRPALSRPRPKPRPVVFEAKVRATK